MNLSCLNHQMNSFQTQAAVHRWGNDPGDRSPPPGDKLLHYNTPADTSLTRCSYQCCSCCPSSDHTAWLQLSQHRQPQEVTLLICSGAQRTQDPLEEEAGDPRDPRVSAARIKQRDLLHSRHSFPLQSNIGLTLVPAWKPGEVWSSRGQNVILRWSLVPFPI